MSLQRIHIQTPLGPMLIAASEQALAGVWFEAQQHMPDYSTWDIARDHLVLQHAALEIERYFNGQTLVFSTPRMAAWGTDFQKEVWETLMTIPYGQTVTYGEIAKRLNRPNAVRAVGGAVGRNPWSLIAPCHRVVGAKGGLTGYAGGLERKIALLKLEGAIR